MSSAKVTSVTVTLPSSSSSSAAPSVNLQIPEELKKQIQRLVPIVDPVCVYCSTPVSSPPSCAYCKAREYDKYAKQLTTILEEMGMKKDALHPELLMTFTGKFLELVSKLPIQKSPPTRELTTSELEQLLDGHGVGSTTTTAVPVPTETKSVKLADFYSTEDLDEEEAPAKVSVPTLTSITLNHNYKSVAIFMLRGEDASILAQVMGTNHKVTVVQTREKHDFKRLPTPWISLSNYILDIPKNIFLNLDYAVVTRGIVKKQREGDGGTHYKTWRRIADMVWVDYNVWCGYGEQLQDDQDCLIVDMKTRQFHKWRTSHRL